MKGLAGGAAVRALSQISYSGWSTAQKLQAVQSGLFPGLTDIQKSDLIDSLKADQDQQELVSNIQKVSQDLGNIATIAHNIGLPPEVTKDVQGAQMIASGVMEFSTGNYLGAVASITSLVGLGAPDAAAERQAAMMKYLQKQFAIIN